MRVLVTGSGGFVGRAIAQALHTAGSHEVVLLHRRSRGLRNEVVGDLTDPELPGKLPERTDLIVHAGGYVPEKEAAADMHLAMASNAEGTLRLLEYGAIAGAKRFVHISSAAVYGSPVVAGAVTESIEPRPDNAYAFSKLAAELMLEPYRFVHGMETVALRFSYVYGDGMRESSVVKKFAAMARSHVPIPLLNGGRDFFDLIHISDAVRAVESAMRQGGGVYNIGSGKPTSVLELAEALIETTGSRSVVQKLPATTGYHSKYLDVSKALTGLNWQPMVNLREGLHGL